MLILVTYLNKNSRGSLKDFLLDKKKKRKEKKLRYKRSYLIQVKCKKRETW